MAGGALRTWLGCGGALWWIGAAQVYDLSDVPPPPARTLETRAYFYVAPSDNPYDLPSVYFRKMRLAPVNSGPIDKYGGLEVTIMRDAVFREEVDLHRFCSDDGSFIMAEMGGSATLKVRVKEQDFKNHPIGLVQPGLYVLVVTNCGNVTGFDTFGSVEVRGPQGLLSTIELNSKTFYFYGAVFFAVVGVVWLVLCLRFWASLLDVQKGVLLTLTLCILESIAWWAFFNAKNSSGACQPTSLFVAATISTWKFAGCFYALTGNPAKGADDAGLGWCMQILLILFALGQFELRILGALRHTFNISTTFVLLSSLPEVVLGTALVWIAYQKQSGIVEMLEQEKDDKKALMYQRLKLLVVCAGFTHFCATLLMVFDPTSADMSTWWYHFWASDAIPQACFAFWILVAMFLTLPSLDLLGYDYAEQAQGDATAIGAPATIWDDSDCEDPPPQGPHSNGLVAVE